MSTKTRDPSLDPNAIDRAGLPGAPADPASLPAVQPETTLEAEEQDDDWFAETFTAIFGGHSRAGRWDAPDHATARSLFGEVKLDFTQAILPADGEVEIEASAIFGSVEITVPDDAEVELLGSPIFGSIEHKRRGKPVTTRLREMVTGETADFEPVLDDEPPARFRITCNVIFGSVEVFSR